MQPHTTSGKPSVYFSYFFIVFLYFFAEKYKKQSPVLAKVLARPIMQVDCLHKQIKPKKYEKYN